MQNDGVEEENAVMNERASEPPAISADVLREAIAQLCEGPAEAVDASATVRDAIELMQRKGFGSSLVTEGTRLVGIVTERDVLMKVAGKDPALLDRPVTAIMTANPESLRKDDRVVYLMNKMHMGGFRHVPIVDAEDRPLHLISIRDVLGYLLEHFGSIVATVPPEPFRGERMRDGG